MPVYRGEFKPGHPPFADNGPSACGTSDGPADINADDIVYSGEDNKIIDEYHRQNGTFL
jgi:alcohol oxidase